MSQVGKREFTLQTSKYLKKVEETGEEIIITHQGEPRLKLLPFRPKSIRDLAGLIKRYRLVGKENEPILPGFDQWSS